MKVKIFTEGGTNIGFGHITRCFSLYKELKERNNEVFFYVSGESLDNEFLKDVPIINSNWQDKAFLYESVDANDYVIIDSYHASKELCGLVSNLTKRVLFIDDYGRIDFPSGLILNPTFDTSNINYSLENRSSLLTGPEYVLVRAPFFKEKRKGFNESMSKVFVTFGGTDIKGLIPQFLKEVCLDRIDFIFNVVLGSREIELCTDFILKRANIKLHHNVSASEMAHLMLDSDIAITAAGQTIYELIATDTPFIPIVVIDNQENNILSLQKLNRNLVYFSYDEENLFKKINKTLDLAKDLSYRTKLYKSYTNLLDGESARRIIDRLLEN